MSQRVGGFDKRTNFNHLETDKDYRFIKSSQKKTTSKESSNLKWHNVFNNKELN